MNGIITISLDFEMMWGYLDCSDINGYGDNVLGGKKAIPRILELFTRYGIHATWGVVGFIYKSGIEEAKKTIPEKLPSYKNPKYSAYSYLDGIKPEENRYFFAPELIQLIRNAPYQEIATHTYSHFYCVEKGQTKEQFEEDLRTALATAAENGDTGIKSIIFPRNQGNPDYAEVLKENGITAYRGNEEGILYQPSGFEDSRNIIRRAVRLLDAYINLSGYHCKDIRELNEDGIVNVTASRYMRPYSKPRAFLEGLRLERIKKQMTNAAENGRLFHLWWHPHDFGLNTDKNLANLKEILENYEFLNQKYGFESKNIGEVAEVCINGREDI